MVAYKPPGVRLGPDWADGRQDEPIPLTDQHHNGHSRSDRFAGHGDPLVPQALFVELGELLASRLRHRSPLGGCLPGAPLRPLHGRESGMVLHNRHTTQLIEVWSVVRLRRTGADRPLQFMAIRWPLPARRLGGT